MHFHSYSHIHICALCAPMLSQLFAYISLLYIFFHSSSHIHIYALCPPPTCCHSSALTALPTCIYALSARLLHAVTALRTYISALHMLPQLLYLRTYTHLCSMRASYMLGGASNHSSSQIHLGPAEHRRSSSEASISLLCMCFHSSSHMYIYALCALMLSQLFAYTSLLCMCFHSSSHMYIYALCALMLSQLFAYTSLLCMCFHSSSHMYIWEQQGEHRDEDVCALVKALLRLY